MKNTFAVLLWFATSVRLYEGSLPQLEPLPHLKAVSQLQAVLQFYVQPQLAKLSQATASSVCDDWLPFKDRKCFKLADKAGQQTYEDAEVVCKAYTETSRLVTIKTKEEQEFLQQLIFVDHEVADNIWLGLKEKGTTGIFQWNDGSQVTYSNWLNQTIADEQHHCVEMGSGTGVYPTGLWAKVVCKKRNLVLCERDQMGSLEGLQSMFLSLKKDLEKLADDWEQKFRDLKDEVFEAIKSVESPSNNTITTQQIIDYVEQANEKTSALVNFQKQRIEDLEVELHVSKKETDDEICSLKKRNVDVETETAALKQRTEANEREIENLKRTSDGDETSVPVGFIYIQLPTQEPPSILWPTLNWTEVSSSYAGLFFRVIGGQAAPFGYVQEGNSSRLQVVEYSTTGPGFSPVTVPSDGHWSNYVWTAGGSGKHRYMRFRLSSTEVRPRNQAIKIWKRTI